MPGMQRFVSYLYLYENEEKAGNVGFAKIELRGEECRIEVHLRGTFTNNLSCKIYLFTNREGFIHGIHIGGMKILNGAGNFAGIVPQGRIGSAGKKFADMDGLLVLSEDERIFATRWKEGEEVPIGIRTFREEMTESAPGEQNGAAAPEAAASKAGEQSRKSVSEPSPAASEPTVEPERQSAPEPTVESGRESAPEPQPQPPTELEAPATPEASAEPKPAERSPQATPEAVDEPTMQATEVPMRNIFPELEWREKWENMLKEYPVTHPLQDGEITCIRIELKDLRELPKRYWYLGNNSFLLHGFFNYHCLILGKRVEDGVERWFLGVPGVYQHQERVMAAIFGFQEFLPEARNHEKRGEPVNQFGYWCRQMDD